MIKSNSKIDPHKVKQLLSSFRGMNRGRTQSNIDKSKALYQKLLGKNSQV